MEHSVLKANAQIVYETFPDGEVMAYDEVAGQTYILNVTASWAYRLSLDKSCVDAEKAFVEFFLQNKEADQELIEDEVGLYDKTDLANDESIEMTAVTEEQLRKDYRCILQDLIDKKLLEEI